MALTPAENDALIREINDAVRHDDLHSIWSRFGRWIIAAIVLALLAFGGWLLWQDHSQKQADAQGERFAELIADAKNNKADDATVAELSTSSTTGIRAGALLTRAALQSGHNDSKGAIETYGTIIADSNLAQPYRDLATVRQTALQFDSLPPQQVIDRLKPLAQPGNAWFGSAGEMTALALNKLGRRQQAGELFAQLAKDPDVVRTIQTRAVQMASLLGVDAQIAPKPGESKESAANAQ